MIKRWLAWPGFVFGLVFGWKLILLIISAQPVPANDSFFYDGPVVNFLLHGRYVNPALAETFPISGTEVFSAYPPLYQVLLLGWMLCFGTSALSAMWLHLLLFGAYIVVLFAILRRMNTPVWCIHIAGVFLFLITFHDRPDSLAHLLGMLGVYSWTRSLGWGAQAEAGTATKSWSWGMVIFMVLSLCASLQIGAIYLF